MYLYDGDGNAVAQVIGHDSDGFAVIVEAPDFEPDPEPWQGWTDHDYTRHAREARTVPGDVPTADPADAPSPRKTRRKTA
jgi:hypothetical protein